MRLLAFDLATRCGVAFGPTDGDPRLWTVDIGSTDPHEGARFAQAEIAIKGIIKANQPTRIAVESAMTQGGAGAAKTKLTLIGYRAILMRCAFAAGRIPVEEMAPATWRKHFLGNGRLSGAKAKRETEKRCASLGWWAEDHNAAEAAGLWDAVACKYGRQSPVAGGFL